MSLPTIYEDSHPRIRRSYSISESLLHSQQRHRIYSDPFLNVQYSCYLQPPVIEKWKYIKRSEQPLVYLDQPEALPPLVYIRSSWIDPAALGIFGFGFGSFIFCLQYLVPKYSINYGFLYVILLPGILQIISGFIDVQRGSYFGAITFIGYGMTIVGDGLTLFFASFFPKYTQFQSASNIASIVFTIGTLLMSINMAVMYTLLLLVTLCAFILQTIMSFYSISPIPVGIVWGIVTGISTYIFFAEIVNTVSEKHLIPLGNALFNYKTLQFQNPLKYYHCFFITNRIKCNSFLDTILFTR